MRPEAHVPAAMTNYVLNCEPKSTLPSLSGFCLLFYQNIKENSEYTVLPYCPESAVRLICSRDTGSPLTGSLQCRPHPSGDSSTLA